MFLFGFIFLWNCLFILCFIWCCIVMVVFFLFGLLFLLICLLFFICWFLFVVMSVFLVLCVMGFFICGRVCFGRLRFFLSILCSWYLVIIGKFVILIFWLCWMLFCIWLFLLFCVVFGEDDVRVSVWVCLWMIWWFCGYWFWWNFLFFDYVYCFYLWCGGLLGRWFWLGIG